MSYTLVLEWMPGDLYMSAVTARCTAPTSSYSVVWLPPNKVYQITLYCGSTSLVSFLVGAFRGKAWSYMKTLLSCEFNMDTGCVELRYSDDSMISINCTAVEDEVANSRFQRSELDWLIYNDPLSYAELILNGDPEKYLRTVTEIPQLDSD